MGLKKIAELRKDLQQKADALEKFTDAAKQFSDTYAKIALAFDQVEKMRVTNRAKIRPYPPLGLRSSRLTRRALRRFTADGEVAGRSRSTR